MSKTSITVTTQVDEDLWVAIKKEALDRQVNLPIVVNEALQEHLEKQEEQERLNAQEVVET